MEIGKRLRELRKSLNFTQKEFAKKIAIDYTYIGKIERGEQNPSLKILQKIANRLNIDIEYFFSKKPLEYYIERKKSVERDKQILELLSNLNEVDKNFLVEIIKLLNKYNKLKSSVKYSISESDILLKVADKDKRYRKK